MEFAIVGFYTFLLYFFGISQKTAYSLGSFLSIFCNMLFYNRKGCMRLLVGKLYILSVA